MNDYPIKKRELIAQAPGLRVQILTLTAGQCVPWHSHSQIVDTFFCLEGPMRIQTRNPDADLTLAAGEQAAAAVGQPHRVSGAGDGPCRFAIVQGVGQYDFVPEPE